MKNIKNKLVYAGAIVASFVFFSLSTCAAEPSSSGVSRSDPHVPIIPEADPGKILVSLVILFALGYGFFRFCYPPKKKD